MVTAVPLSMYKLQRKGTVLMLRTVQFMNGLLGQQTKGMFVNGLSYSRYGAKSHVCALFVNTVH